MASRGLSGKQLLQTSRLYAIIGLRLRNLSKNASAPIKAIALTPDGGGGAPMSKGHPKAHWPFTIAVSEPRQLGPLPASELEQDP